MRKVILWMLCMTGAVLRCAGVPPEKTMRPVEIVEIELARQSVLAEARAAVDNDAVYGGARAYFGESLAGYVRRLRAGAVGDGDDVMVQFVCSDGYNPIAAWNVLSEAGAFLATRDAAAPPGALWVPVEPSNPLSKTPAPAYLVWPHSREDPAHPWPYGVVALRIGSRAALLGPAEPAQPAVRPGYELFLQHCIKCHSINGAGGTMGVDLNYPRNVFEYWKAEMLPGFVVDPSSYRANGKMPPFPALQGDGVTRILEYIESMKKQKQQPVRPERSLP